MRIFTLVLFALGTMLCNQNEALAVPHEKLATLKSGMFHCGSREDLLEAVAKGMKGKFMSKAAFTTKSCRAVEEDERVAVLGKVFYANKRLGVHAFKLRRLNGSHDIRYVFAGRVVYEPGKQMLA